MFSMRHQLCVGAHARPIDQVVDIDRVGGEKNQRVRREIDFHPSDPGRARVSKDIEWCHLVRWISQRIHIVVVPTHTHIASQA
jgi:hypothetical protein